MASKRQASGAVKVLRNFIKKCKEARAAHPSTAKKKRKKSKTKRDPSWYGHKKGHRKAAKKGWRGRKKKTKSTGHRKGKGHHKGRSKARRDPAYYGHHTAHARAAKKGWRHAHRRRDPEGDPARFRRGRLGRRRSAVGPWYMGHDPE